MSVVLLEVSLLGARTVLRLERDAWSMVKRLRLATDEYAASPRAPAPPRGPSGVASLLPPATWRLLWHPEATPPYSSCSALISRFYL